MPRTTSEKTRIRNTGIETPWGAIRWRSFTYERSVQNVPAIVNHHPAQAPLWVKDFVTAILFLLAAYLLLRLQSADEVDGPLRLGFLA